VDRAAFRSKGRNTPFHGHELKGRALATWVGGRRVFDLAAAPAAATGSAR
jgi:dihydroorotase